MPLDSLLQLVRIARRAELADDAGYFFLGILHVSESERGADADALRGDKGQGMENSLAGSWGFI